MLLALVVAVAVTVLVVDLEALVQRRLPAVEARLSERLGRQVTVGAVRVALWPATLEVTELRVAGAAPGAPPLLVAPLARARVATRPFLFSLGRRLEVEALELERPEIDVARARDGTWSFADIQDALAAPEAAAPGRVDIALSRLTITSGSAVIRDRREGHTLGLRRLTLAASGFEAGAPLEVELRASLVDGPRESPLVASARLDDVSEALEGRGLPRGRLRLEVTSLALAPWLGLLPDEDGLRVTAGAVTGALTVSRGRVAPLDADGALELEGLDVRGPRGARPVVGLGGEVRLEGGRPLSVRFDLRGERLDLDALEAAAFEGERPSLPASARLGLAQLAAGGDFAFEGASVEGIPLRDVEGQARLEGGGIAFDALRFEAYGGQVEAGGTRLELDADPIAWSLRASLADLDLNAALRDQANLGGVFRGTVGARLDVAGRGLTHTSLEETLEGAAVVDGERLAWRRLDVATSILRQLRAAAPLLGALPRLPEGGTTLERFTAPLRIEDGRFLLEAPLVATTAFGALSIEGSVRFGGALALRAQATITPEAVRRWTDGLLAPSGDVRLPLRIGGTLAEPRVTVLELGPLLELALETGLQRGAAPLLEGLEQRAGQELRRLLEPPR